jgi:hypothetical protein
MKRARILMTASDPGGANALFPVYSRLKDKTAYTVRCLVSARATEAFGVGSTELEICDTPAALSIASIWQPDIIVVATSEEYDAKDRQLTLWGKIHHVPVICVLDYWSQYRERFSGPLPAEKLRYEPDIICAMDSVAAHELTACGIAAGRIEVTGHPHLEHFGDIPWLSSQECLEYRRELGIGEDEQLVTFASETLGWSYTKDYRFPPLFEQTDRTIIILEHVMACLHDIGKEGKSAIVCLNKLHPKNDPREFRHLDHRLRSFRLVHISKTDTKSLLQASDVVVGMTSMFLLEAALLNRPVISAVPLESEESFLPFRDHFPNWLIAANPEILRALLRNALARCLQPTARAGEALVAQHRGATERIVKVIDRVLNNKKPQLSATYVER